MHMRKIGGELRRLGSLSHDELYVAAKELQAPYELVQEVAERQASPVVLFTAGGHRDPGRRGDDDAARAPRASSSGPGSSSPATRPSGPRPSCKATTSTTTPT
jgi:pyridoxal 5'-phosphate synthase pdxS subunit